MSQKKQRPRGRRAGQANRAFASAQEAYDHGQYKKAIRHLTALLTVTPNHLEGVVLLSRINAEQGDLRKAINLMERAASFAPDKADYDIHLAELHYQASNRARAYEHLEKAYGKDHTHPKVIDGLASLGFELARSTKDPQRWMLAANHLARFCEMRPDDVQKHWMLADAYDRIGDSEQRCLVLRHIISLEGQTSAAHHLLAAAEGRQDIEKASSSYVTQVFDAAADEFEENLITNLNYATPSHLARLLEDTNAGPTDLGRVLDLGCGTGLMGRAIAEYASELVGVDVSRKMIEQATTNGGYDALYVDDIDTFLDAVNAPFDCVIAADVLIYYGGLERLFERALQCLNQTGQFAFSIELGQAGPYHLSNSGRFTHRHDYIMALAEMTGLYLMDIAAVPLRVEAGHPVAGVCYVFGVLADDDPIEGRDLDAQRLFRHARVHYELEDYARAYRAGTTCLSMNGQHAEALDLLAMLEASQAKFEVALAKIERALSLEPTNSSFQMHHGMILAAMGLSVRAAQAFGLALESQPGDPVLLVNYGVSLRMSGQHEEAIKVFQHILQQVGHAFEVHFNLAAAHRSLGALDESRYHLDLALRMSDDPERIKDEFHALFNTDA
ncbi:MAG: tetratricopeptide repeat protein [Myxococcota bacterium]|nr:tetratricopeptide repeat protein [Myxococcota bacterium]